MAMAVVWRGLDVEELAAWTGAMLHSGEVLNLAQIDRPKVDKHSTGGVGDKVSIPLAPMVAACGVAVPMISGRGLGHTGGTLDKLESIEGFTTALDTARFVEILDECGLVMAGQSETLVPADRKLYALRDATGTVPSIPLMASSIMSKKLAEDLDGLVLDVKVGSGAFMADIDAARQLAETMCGIGMARGVKTVALITSMDSPLGLEIGNALEIREAIEVLNGRGPDDLVEVTMALGVEMLRLAGAASTSEDARARLEQTIRLGTALSHFEQVIAAQGGDPSVVEHPERLPVAPLQHELAAHSDGFVTRTDARKLGFAAMRLGAGRERQEETIDPAVGITLRAKPGDQVAMGQSLATLSFRHPGRLPDALQLLDGAFDVGDEPPPPAPLVLERIG
jgi:pyrimidine-nucleoside phosphorylase